MKLDYQKGQSLIELLLAMGLSVLFLPALITGLTSTREGKPQQNQRITSITLMKEAQEGVRVVREAGWSAIGTNGTYHPEISGNSWILAAGTENISGFTRSVIISDVLRDTNCPGSTCGNIVSSGGTVDPSTKKVVVNVSWNQPQASTVSQTLYLTRFMGNTTFVQTTDTDFSSGSLSNTEVTTTQGGEVILGEGGYGDWCTPDLTLAQVDLPKNGVANAVSAIEGAAVAGTGDNSSGISFAKVIIPNTYPPVPTLGYTFDGYKTNGVFGEPDYAYIATDNNGKEVAIIDLNNVISGKYQLAGYFNATGNGNGGSVYAVGNVGYMTGGNIMRTFDLSSHTGARAQLDSITLAATGQRVVVNGNYAYVAIAGATTELQIIDVSNPSDIRIVGQADINGEAATDVYINAAATRAYLVTTQSSSQREFFIVDISTKTGNRPTLGSYDSNGMSPKGVAVITAHNKAVIGGSGAEEYQVINIANETNPVRCGGMQVNSGVNGVSSIQEADGDAYSYIITGDTATEFKIIRGGPGGIYLENGTYESATFAYPNTSGPQQIELNRFIATISKPANTDITLQLATADPVAGSCAGATYAYVGPDGTAGTYFTAGGNTIAATLPFATLNGLKNPTSCIRYKAYLTSTDHMVTPVLYDFTLNYSF